MEVETEEEKQREKKKKKAAVFSRTPAHTSLTQLIIQKSKKKSFPPLGAVFGSWTEDERTGDLTDSDKAKGGLQKASSALNTVTKGDTSIK